MRLKLNAILTAWNEVELEQMYALADALNIPLTMDPTVTPRDDGDTTPVHIRPSATAVKRLFRFTSPARARTFRPASTTRINKPRLGDATDACDGTDGACAEKHCGAGSSALAVDPLGNVYPCVQWRRPTRQPAPPIHHPAVAQRRRVNPGARTRPPHKAGMVEGLGEAARHAAFCPGLAELESGSPLQLYPAAQEKLDIVGRLLKQAQ